jgi:hypothetical protein
MALALLPQRDTDPIWSQEFGIQNINTSTLCNFPPSSDIAGIQRFGGRGDCIRPITNDYYYIADMSYTKGKHQMAWGFTFVDKFLQHLSASWTQGAFSFTGVNTGNGMADFLLGNPEVAQGAVPGAPNRTSPSRLRYGISTIPGTVRPVVRPTTGCCTSSIRLARAAA